MKASKMSIIRTQAYNPPPQSVQSRRSSSTETLQRRVLDLYASQRKKRRTWTSVAALAIVSMFVLVLGGWFGGMGNGEWPFPRINGVHSLGEEFVGSTLDTGVEQHVTDVAAEAHVEGSVDGGGMGVVGAEGGEGPGTPVMEGEFAALDYVTPRDVPAGHVSLKAELPRPEECEVWREVARNESGLVLYQKHFASLDMTDWFTYVALFDELFHWNMVRRHRRPRYLDVAANHARRWSATWFYDRCMGWDGVCVEANSKYHKELLGERHCYLVDTCVSDREKKVRFAMTSAYGGVVTGDGERFGVDGKRHATETKFKNDFDGFKELTCTTIKKEMNRLGIAHFDFMSLDVEGHELPVLQGMDWQKLTIDVIVIENRSPPVIEFLKQVGYELHEGLLKDHLWIRRDSGLVLNPKYVDMMKRLDKKTRRFSPAKSR